MNKTMLYKGYIGNIEYSEAGGVFYGRVQNVPALVSYEGRCIEELELDFRSAVEDYLELREEFSPAATDR